jgi:DNA-binding helix-hairpin-helix protein with protein kinase domain
MQSIVFRDDMVKTRRLIQWTTVLLLVLGLAGILMIVLGGKPLYNIVKIVAAVGSAIFILTLAFLRFYYLSRTEARQKHKLMNQIRKSQTGLAKAQEALVIATQEEARVRGLSQERQNAEKAKFESLAGECKNKIDGLRTDQEQELAAELAKLGEAHLDAALQATPLDPAAIPGIGAVLADKLQASGIRTAHDVTQEAIQGIEGFGESHILSLTRWRESVEHTLSNAAPQGLPEEQRMAIEQRYNVQILAIQNEQSAAHAAYETNIADLRAEEAKGTAAAVAEGTSARQRLSTLEAQQQEAKNQAGLYKHITFPRLLSAALVAAPANWGKRVLSFIVLFVYILSGILNIAVLIYSLVSSRLQ